MKIGERVAVLALPPFEIDQQPFTVDGIVIPIGPARVAIVTDQGARYLPHHCQVNPTPERAADLEAKWRSGLVSSLRSRLEEVRRHAKEAREEITKQESAVVAKISRQLQAVEPKRVASERWKKGSVHRMLRGSTTIDVKVWRYHGVFECLIVTDTYGTQYWLRSCGFGRWETYDRRSPIRKCVIVEGEE